MPSLVTVMGQELARLLEPLVTAAGAPERWPLVLDLVGHTADVLGNAGLRNALDELGALAKLDGADLETWDGIATLLTTSSRAMQALHDLEHAVDDPALASRLAGLGPELAQQLAAVYLRQYHSRLFRVAANFGIIDPAEAHAAQPAQFDGAACVRAAWSNDEIHLERIGPLLRDPFTVLRATYLPNDLRAAADAHAAADAFFPLLRAALGEFGLATRDDRVSLLPDDPTLLNPDGDHFDDPQPDPDDPAPPPVDITPAFHNSLPHLTIRIPQLQADGSLAGTFLGVDVAVSSLEHPGAFAGLVVGLAGALNWTQTQGSWAVGLQTSGEVPAFGIGPQGMALAPGAAALAEASGSFTVSRVADGAPAFVFGSPTGTRLELGKVQFGIGFTATASHVSGNLGIAVDKAALVIGGGDGDGFLSSVLPANGLRADFDLGLTLDSDKGFALHGGAGLLASLPVGLSLGGLAMPTLHVGVRTDNGQLATELSVDVALAIGPVQASLDRIGMLATVSFPDGGGNLGVADLAIGFQPPAGAGIAIDASGGVVTGGGFLFKDPAQPLYSGVLQLTVHERLTLTAFGLIATRLPDGSRGYSMIVFITAQGFQPIQLGMGFTLLGIGGIVAIHRTFDEDVLRAGLKNDTLAALLFPNNPVANAPATISALAAAFPAQVGSYLLGLLVRIGWFTPTLVTLDLALVMQFGTQHRLLVLGRIAALLPTADNDLVRLVLDAIGVVDFDVGTASIDALLVDSRLAHKFPITGSMAMRARWTSGPDRGFVMAVGGLNPHFAAPETMPVLQRVAISLSSGDNPRLVCDAYLAITDNTVQFGSDTQLHAAAYGFSIDGDVGFDVLIQISPLHFIADYHASVQLKHGDTNLFMVSVDGELEGPRPLRVSGKAEFSIFWCDFTIRLDKTLVDGDPPPPPAAVDVLAALAQALADPANWIAVPADEHTQGVSLRRLAASPALVLDPLGQLQVRQQVVPLATTRDIDLFGGAPVSGDRRFVLQALLDGVVQDATPLSDAFAPAQFFAMSDDEKLAAPAVETMTSGLAFGVEAAQFDADGCVGAPLAYEQIVVDDLAAPPPPKPDRPRIGLAPERLLAWSAIGAAARAPLRTTGRARFRANDVVVAAALAPPSWEIVPLGDGAPAVLATPPRTYAEHLGALALLNRAAGAWQIVPTHELTP